MGTLQLYLLKSAVALSLLYSFYWLMLRNETYYSWNRLFLLGSMILSFIFPLFSFSVQNIPTGGIISVLNPVNISGYFTSTEPLSRLNTISILSIIYISGAVFFCLRFLSGLARIHFLYYRFPKYKFSGFKAVVLDNDQSPFTFFNILFISRTDFGRGKIDEMIVHEKAHKEEFHTFDILLMEIMTIIQWFNPFIWLFRRALRSEHEFKADKRVLLEGFDMVKYQKMLFEKSLGVTSLSLTNNFNYSLLKKRLKMMTNKKSSSWMKIKYLLSVPMLLLTIMLTAINFSSYGQKDKVYTQVDVMPQYKNGGHEAMSGLIQQSIVYPKTAQDHNISARIYVQFLVNEKGKVSDVKILRSDILDNSGKKVIEGYTAKANPEIDPKSVADLEAEAARIIKLLGDFIPAQRDGKDVSIELTIPLNFVLGEDKKK